MTIRDGTATGKPLTVWEVAGLPERMTVRELIRLRGREPRRIDWERQAEIAERAFLANGFFVPAGDREVEDLDDRRRPALSAQAGRWVVASGFAACEAGSR